MTTVPSPRKLTKPILLLLTLVGLLTPAARATLVITNNSPLTEWTCRTYNQTLSVTGPGQAPYAWYLSDGALPINLSIATALDGTNGTISGVIDSSMVNTTNTFTVNVMDASNLETGSKQFTLVIREGWDHPVLSPNDFESSGIAGGRTWSDPNAWAGGLIPTSAAGKVVNIEQISTACTNNVDGTYTIGTLRSRPNNTDMLFVGNGTLIFDNGTNQAIWNLNSRVTRYTTLRADAFVNIQLNSDLDLRMGTARADGATIGRIGKTISGTGKLTLTLGQNDASSTRFEKLGVAGPNTYSGGTLVRHPASITYGTAFTSQAALQLNALSTNSFGTGDVTLDAYGCTFSMTFAPALNRGMWVKFSTNDVIQPGKTLTLTNTSRLILDLAANTTNTAYVVADGLAVDAGTYTGGSFPWLFGTGKLVVLSSTPPPVVQIVTASPLPPGREDAAYNQTLSAANGTAPYTWSVLLGNLPAGLTLSSGGVISGTALQPETASFTVQAIDASNLSATKTYQLQIHSVVPPKVWSAPTISAADYNATNSGSFTWSDPTAWTGGVVPLNVPGKQVSIEPRFFNVDVTNIVDTTVTLGGLSSRSSGGNIGAVRGEGKLVFDNGTNTAIWNHNNDTVRFTQLRPDAYVDIELKSDLDFRMGGFRFGEAAVGRIGRNISGTGHLTLTLAENDSFSTGFFKLGENSTNTYSGGTTIRHVSTIPYGDNHNTQYMLQVNALSQGAFGTGDVTLDGTNLTGSYANQLAYSRGLWVRFSTNDVIRSGAVLNLLSATNIAIEVLADTTNTAYVNIDGVPVPAGVYTGGSTDWLYGFGTLVVLGSAPSLTATYDGTALKLEWPGNAVLQSAPEISGTYTNVPGAVSPYYLYDFTEPQKFFRLLSQ